MANEFVAPNLHVALIHFPMALLLVGVLIELFSFMWRRHAFRSAGRWMILLGALSSIPTATSGIYALSDVSKQGLDPAEASGPWKDVAAASPLWKNPDSEPAEMMREHAWHQSIATGLAVLVVVCWIGCSDRWRAKLHLPLLAVMLVAAGFLLSGAWHGGEAVYRHGVAVQKEGVNAATPPPVSTDSTAANLQIEKKLSEQIEHYLPPLQVHVILAGTAVAVALAALALSIRAVSQGQGTTQMDEIASGLGGADDSPFEDETRRALVERLPTARFWLLAFLIALLTSAAGWWVLSRGIESYDLQKLWNEVRDPDQNPGHALTRRLAHGAAGGAIIILPVLLAIVARGAPRAKFLLMLFALLLILAVAAQIWLGVLLLYDTNVGPITQFNK